MMVHERKIEKKERLYSSSLPTAPPPKVISKEARELAMMNMTIVILEEVKFLRKKITDLETDFQQSQARKEKQGKNQRRRHSPLHVSRQSSFCVPSRRHQRKRHITIRIIPPKTTNIAATSLPISKRKIYYRNISV